MYQTEIYSFRRYTFVFTAAMSILLTTCMSNQKKVSGDPNKSPATTQNDRRVVVFPTDSSKLTGIIDFNAEVAILGSGFIWTEGPLWIGNQQMLLFTDVPANKVFSWTESEGVKEYLHPSGYTGTATPSKEPGANGLALSPEGQLLLCQHGDRRVARMEAPLHEPKPVFTTVIDSWQNKRFNSPNDLVVNSKGQIFFTDPPYGLDKQAEDPTREIDFQGVYRRDPDGRLVLIVNDLSRPNGVALSPDEKTLYVSNSDPDRAIWMAYALDEHGNAVVHELFYDATSLVPTHKGLPDGLKVNREGIVFATGPGGVWIFDRHGNPLGRIETGQATANCALNTDESVLYLCADDYLMRVRLKS